MPSHPKNSNPHSHHHENLKSCTISQKLSVTLNIKGILQTAQQEWSLNEEDSLQQLCQILSSQKTINFVF